MLLRTDRQTKTAADNSRLPQWGLTWLNQVLCFLLAFVLVNSEMLRNPPERKARKRYLPF